MYTTGFCGNEHRFTPHAGSEDGGRSGRRERRGEMEGGETKLEAVTAAEVYTLQHPPRLGRRRPARRMDAVVSDTTGCVASIAEKGGEGSRGRRRGGGEGEAEEEGRGRGRGRREGNPPRPSFVPPSSCLLPLLALAPTSPLTCTCLLWPFPSSSPPVPSRPLRFLPLPKLSPALTRPSP